MSTTEAAKSPSRKDPAALAARDPEAIVWGRLIESARLAEYLTQTELADAINDAAKLDGNDLSVSQPTVSSWEGGWSKPTLRHRKYVCVALAKSHESLFPQIGRAA